MKQQVSKVTSILATLTALLGSCCVLPILLLSLTGTVGFATALVPYQKVFTAVTIVLLAVAFYAVYGRQKATCEVGEICSPKSQKVTKILLWVSTGLALTILLGPLLLPCLSNP